MKQRLLQFIEEFNRGVQQLEALDCQRAQLRDRLMRVSGAIQVLRELCQESAADAPILRPIVPSNTGVESTTDAA